MWMNWMSKLLGIAGALAEEGGAVADAAVEGAEEAAQISGGAAVAAQLFSMLLPLVLMIAIFYFLMIRPQRKKDKQVKAMLDALKPGDRITTIGGIYGTIIDVKNDNITLAIGTQRTEMVVARWAIRSVEAVSVENDGEVLA